MNTAPTLPLSALDALPPHRGGSAGLGEALARLKRKLVVLDDDPTGIQTVHGVYVYTRWDVQTMTEAFRSPERMFFVLTNSRALSAQESRLQHRQIAQSLAAASAATGQDFLLLSRGDSTLRGHWPLETEVLRGELEALAGRRFDGEVLYPFFPEGGRYTLGGVHYVRQGEQLVPAGETEFARDKSFGYRASALGEWCEEKSEGRVRAADCRSLSLELLRAGEAEAVAAQLEAVSDFGKIIVDSADYRDVEAFAAGLCLALSRGKSYLFRCAAALPKVLGAVPDRPLLGRAELAEADSRRGGILLVGSHVEKTSRQLEALRWAELPLRFLPFDQHRVLEEGGLEQETGRVLALAEAEIAAGRSVAVFTRRERLDLEGASPEEQLKISTRISDALTAVIGRLSLRPAFVVAKGGITSSDVGVKALGVRRALVLGQVRPGVPVWQCGEESRFPGLPYVIFPGNVGDDEDLRRVLETLLG